MIRQISQVELTSRCNLRCKYCPHPSMRREKADMPEAVFARVLYWLREFRQASVHLHHFGESTLHPRFLEYVDRISDVVPDVRLSSNGVGVTPELVRGMKRAGLTRLSLSVHRPEVVRIVAGWCDDLGMAWDYAAGAIIGTHNWAGQVEGRNTVSYPCHFLEDDKCVVLADGRLVACCIDAEGESARGSVFDDLREIAFAPFRLCASCHHVVPEAKFPGWRRALERIPLAESSIQLTRPQSGRTEVV